MIKFRNFIQKLIDEGYSTRTGDYDYGMHGTKEVPKTDLTSKTGSGKFVSFGYVQGELQKFLAAHKNIVPTFMIIFSVNKNKESERYYFKSEFTSDEVTYPKRINPNTDPDLKSSKRILGPFEMGTIIKESTDEPKIAGAMFQVLTKLSKIIDKTKFYNTIYIYGKEKS